MAHKNYVAHIHDNGGGGNLGIQARDQILAYIMNSENINLNDATMTVFDTGFNEWADKVENGETRQLWGLAKMEMIARKVMARQEVISRAAGIVGEDVLLEEAVREGMDEEEAKRLIQDSLDAIATQKGESKSRKMQKWLDETLDENEWSTDDIRCLAEEEGVVSTDVFQRDNDWNLLCTVASRYGFRGNKKGVWTKGK